MLKNLKAFQIRVNNKILDYRLGKELDINQIIIFFQKKYQVIKIWSGGRHVLGILKKDNSTLFLKLATTGGISVVTRNEYNWNEQFNKLVPRNGSNFWVPQNKDCGVYNKLFYLITDKFEGELLTEHLLQNFLPAVIQFSELIQRLGIDQITDNEDSNHQQWFLNKTKLWYEDIPQDVRGKYEIVELLNIVEESLSKLQKRGRHGDFTPWHLMILKGGALGLIDGEHAKKNGVEYYDIGYFIQRVFSILQNSPLAKDILSLLIRSNYNLEKLRVILAARGIGGFLDESLKSSPSYEFSSRFKNWIISLN